MENINKTYICDTYKRTVHIARRPLAAKFENSRSISLEKRSQLNEGLSSGESMDAVMGILKNTTTL